MIRNPTRLPLKTVDLWILDQPDMALETARRKLEEEISDRARSAREAYARRSELCFVCCRSG